METLSEKLFTRGRLRLFGALGIGRIHFAGEFGVEGRGVADGSKPVANFPEGKPCAAPQLATGALLQAFR